MPSLNYLGSNVKTIKHASHFSWNAKIIAEGQQLCDSENIQVRNSERKKTHVFK